jgi:hypothetical protein
MQEWRMGKASDRIRASVRRVLEELECEALLFLRGEPKLEVMVRPKANFNVWAYFPVYKKRWIAQQCEPKPSTRVLLLFGEEQCEEEGAEALEDHLRDHLGHTLLYLRSPKAPNNCPDAQKEWRSSVRRKTRAIR